MNLNNCVDVNQVVSGFFNVLYAVIEKYVPKRRFFARRHPIWFSKVLIKLLNEKTKIRKRLFKFGNPRDKIEYDLLRMRCHKLTDICESNYKRNMESNICKDPKLIWRYIKDKRNVRPSMPAVMTMGNHTASSGPDVVNLFAEQFSSVYTNSSFSPIMSNINTDSSSVDLKISENDIVRVIKHLNIQKGAGPDNIPPLFVKRCINALTIPLKIIYNMSISQGIFPDESKKARIVPVFKKGN